MKNKLKRGIILSIILLTFAGISLGQALAAKGPMGQILDRLDSYNQRLDSLQADISMKKTDTGLGVSETKNGTTSFIPKKKGKDMYARVDWTKPDESILVVGKKYKLYQPRLNQMIVGSTDTAQSSGKVGGALSFISMSKEERKANFEQPAYLENESAGGRDCFHVRLTPKKKTDYKYAEIWIDSDGLPRQSKVISSNNDSTQVTLTNVRVNQKIDRKVFEISPPNGTKVVNQ
ncbi:hypothetical protein BH10ACI2_BH10ACI2_06860 [soil metagenome]